MNGPFREAKSISEEVDHLRAENELLKSERAYLRTANYGLNEENSISKVDWSILKALFVTIALFLCTFVLLLMNNM